MGIEVIVIVVALILSIVLHEVAHGYAADRLGDPTARLAGRLSPNPIVHIDPVGSVLIPALLLISSAGFLFGWAKPVPYNPYNLRNQKWGEAIVAGAGPATNILLALIFALLIRFADPLALAPSFVEISGFIVYINILLALFNMIPVPPLDGSKILVSILPYGAALKYREFMALTERFGLLFLFVFLFIIIQVVWPYLFSAVVYVGSFLTGLSPFVFIQLIGV